MTITTAEFAAGYDRLLAPLAEAGTQLILIEPFLLPVEGVTEAGDIRIDDDVRRPRRPRGSLASAGHLRVPALGVFSGVQKGPRGWFFDTSPAV
ncbi:hypothetical protein [Amycolatopsis solani]|uniref:hypothetical protein n=1 Tax=Amycolatopsis solani TaxID=3028615 RepID=UPI0025B0DBE3|nr:hypothetical protein [Amycolatopsis sp. MEP2-6]